MFTRMLQIQTKAGKRTEYSNMIHDKVLPILKKQPGFVDEITLVSTTNPDRGFALSFWANKADAERYHREQYAAVSEIMRPLLETPATVETFTVDIFDTHKIAKGKAA